jgi:hypothetical protein
MWLEILPCKGRGTIRRLVEGHVRNRVTLKAQDIFTVPLHQLRWSPSPFRGGF